MKGNFWVLVIVALLGFVASALAVNAEQPPLPNLTMNAPSTSHNLSLSFYTTLDHLQSL